MVSCKKQVTELCNHTHPRAQAHTCNTHNTHTFMRREQSGLMAVLTVPLLGRAAGIAAEMEVQDFRDRFHPNTCLNFFNKHKSDVQNS